MISNGKVVHDPKAYNELADRWARATIVVTGDAQSLWYHWVLPAD